MDDDTKALVVIAKFFLGLVLIPYNAWVASSLWAWHLVPLDLPQIGFWNALGIICLISWCRHEPYVEKGDTYETRLWVREIISPGLLYFIGYIAHVSM